MKNTSVPMIMNRTIVLASTLGHIINFKKGEIAYVPAVLIKEAAAMGAVPSDGSDLHEEPESTEPYQPVAPAERLAAILVVVNAMVESNKREDFTANGTPKVTRVSEETGFKVDGTEVRTVWRDRAAELANES